MQEKIRTIIKEAVEELNEQLEEGRKLEFSDDVRLIGRQAAIDSMDFVALVSIIEELVADKLGKNIRVVSDRAFSMERSPFQSIGTLTDFVAELVK